MPSPRSKAKAKALAATARPQAKRASAAAKPAKSGVVLLSGGNPQIAKAEGDAPVQAYIAACPTWKRTIARRVDELIVETVPNVRKAVKWNSPFYGSSSREGWFLSFHMFANFVRVTFFRGASLRPVPAGPSKYPQIRYYDIREDQLDDAQLASWVEQAAALPGEKL